MLDEINKIGKYAAIRIGIFIFAVSATAQTSSLAESTKTSEVSDNCYVSFLCLNLN